MTFAGQRRGDYRKPIISDQHAAYTEADYAAVMGLAFLAATASSAISAVDIWLAAPRKIRPVGSRTS